MGFYGTYGATRADIIAQVTKTETAENGTQFRTIAKTARGNHLWAVQESAQTDGTTKRFIVLYILRSMGRGEGWGYKPVSEDMGPNETSCPLKYLDMALTAPGPYSAPWRARVRADADQKKTGADLFALAKVGDRVKLPPCYGSKVYAITERRPAKYGKPANIQAREESSGMVFTLRKVNMLGAVLLQVDSEPEEGREPRTLSLITESLHNGK